MSEHPAELPPRQSARSHSRLRPPSSLARLQQLATGVSLLWALCWGLWVWPQAPWAAVLGVVLVLGGYAGVLALELVALTRVHGRDPTPRPRGAELVGAWWQETRMAPRVFAWRQPFVWRRWPDDEANVSQDVAQKTAQNTTKDATPNTAATSASPVGAVVFVHGFVCNRGFWHPWMRALRQRGVPYVSVNLEPVFGPIDDGVPLLEQAVRRAEALSAQPPQLVCHSMGGLVARAWLAADAANAQRVQRVLTIGTPHHGTWLARFSHLPNGRQMRQHSPWLQALAATEARQRPQHTYGGFVCWYSNTDNVVFPASTATLPGADNRLVPGAAHVAMAFHPRVVREALVLLAPGAVDNGHGGHRNHPPERPAPR
jgi:triacylglycerol lipase